MYVVKFNFTRIEDGIENSVLVWEDEYENLTLVCSELNSYNNLYFEGESFYNLKHWILGLEFCFPDQKSFSYDSDKINIHIVVTKVEE